MTEQETPQATPVLPHRPATDEEIAAYKRGALSGAMQSATPNVVASLIARIEQPDHAQAAPFLVTDQAGHVLPAVTTVHASTPLVAVEYVGDCSARIIVPEHDLVEVARRFRRARPKAVTTVRPIRSRRIVATVVVDVPDASGDTENNQAARARAIYDRQAKERQKAGGKAGREKQLGGVMENLPQPHETARDQAGKAVGAATRPAGDRRGAAQQLPGPDPGHIAGVAMAEAECRRREESLTGRRPIG